MTDLHEMPGHLIRRLQQIAVAIFLAEVGDAGYELTPVQFAALRMTRTNPGVDQATLAGLIAYDRSTIGGVVDRLVQKGYVARKTSGRDRRARELRITETGRRILREVESVVDEVQRMILADLTAEEARVFVRLLQKVTKAGNKMSRAPLRTSPRG